MDAMTWIKQHKIVVALFGAAAAGFVLYSYLHKSSNAGTSSTVVGGDTAGAASPQYLIPFTGISSPFSSGDGTNGGTLTSPTTNSLPNPTSTSPPPLNLYPNGYNTNGSNPWFNPGGPMIPGPMIPVSPNQAQTTPSNPPPTITGTTTQDLAAVSQGTALAPATVSQAPTLTGVTVNPGQMINPNSGDPLAGVSTTPANVFASGVGYNQGGVVLGPWQSGMPTPPGTQYEGGMLVTRDPSGL